MPDRVIRTLIQYGFDEGALRQLRAKTAENRRIIEETISRIKSLDVTGKSAASGGLKAFDNVLEKNAARLRKTAEEAQNLTKEVKTLNETTAQTGGASNNLDKVRLVGSQLRALPSMPLPGGISTDQVANVIRLIGNLENLKATFKDLPDIVKTVYDAIGGSKTVGLIGAMGALAIAAALVTAELERQAKQAGKDIDARERAIQLSITGTKEEQQARLDQLANERENRRIVAQDTQAIFKNLQLDIVKTQGYQVLGLQEAASLAGISTGAYSEARKKAVEAAGAVNELDLEIDQLEQRTGLTARTTQQLAEAEEKLNRARNASNLLIESVNNDVANQLEARRLLESGTSEALAKRLDDLKFEKELYSQTAQELRVLQSLQKEGTAAYDAYAAAAEGYEKKARSAEDALNDLGNATLKTGIKAREAAEYTEKQEKEIADAKRKYNDDVKKLEDKANEDRAAAYKKYNDALIKIAEDAAKAADDALLKLQQSRDDLLRDFGRDNVEAVIKAGQEALQRQIDFQRDEAKAARDHADDLLKIQQDKQREEEDLIANRDFAGLFRSRRDTNDQIQEVNRQYERERQERQLAYAQRNEDEARQALYEQQARDRKFQQQNADLELNFRREIDTINRNAQRARDAALKSRNDELTIIQNKYSTQQSLLYRAIVEELRLLQQGSDARKAILLREIADLNAQARVIGSGGGGGQHRARANSGSLFAGQLSSVNERLGQRESFNGSLLPGGKGLFYPLQNGVVSQGRGEGANVNLVFNVRGNNPEATAAAIKKQIAGVFQDVFG